MTTLQDDQETMEARLLEGAAEAADLLDGLRALGTELPAEVLAAAAASAVPSLRDWCRARITGSLAFAEAADVQDDRAIAIVRDLGPLLDDPVVGRAASAFAAAIVTRWFERMGFAVGGPTPQDGPPAAGPEDAPTFPGLDAIAHAYLANLVHGDPGVLGPEVSLPAALAELEDARAWDAGARERAAAAGATTVRVRVRRPDVSLLAAAVACRDGYATPLGDRGVIEADIEPVLALVDPRDGDRVRALVLVSMPRAVWDARSRS